MAMRILVGLDGGKTGEKALSYAKGLATAVGDCELFLAYVIEWSPFTFQTAEENAARHTRRKEEIAAATSKIVDPAVAALAAEGITAKGLVHHGDVADTLVSMGKDNKADLIVVGRTSASSFSNRVFGSSSVSLAINSPIPVTVVG